MEAETIIIRGSFIIKKERDVSGDMKLSHFLQINTSLGTEEKILFEDYQKAFEKTFTSSIQLIENTPDIDPLLLGLAVGNTQVSRPEQNAVLSLILEKLSFPTDFKLSETKEIRIQSEHAEFLELPWETLSNNSYVLREVIHPENLTTGSNPENGFIILMSHAHQPNKPNIQSDINDEILDIIDKVTKNNKDSFKIENIQFLKHGTTSSVSSVDWNKFKYLHVVLHGEKNGSLCLENEANYDQIEFISKENFIQLLKRKNSFKLVYLSFCFSGGGSETSSLAFDLIKNGITESSLAYANGVGSPSAMKFSNFFYNFLTLGHIPKDAFQSALERYKKEHPTSDYIPMLFLREQL